MFYDSPRPCRPGRDRPRPPDSGTGTFGSCVSCKIVGSRRMLWRSCYGEARTDSKVTDKTEHHHADIVPPLPIPNLPHALTENQSQYHCASKENSPPYRGLPRQAVLASPVLTLRLPRKPAKPGQLSQVLEF